MELILNTQEKSSAPYSVEPHRGKVTLDSGKQTRGDSNAWQQPIKDNKSKLLTTHLDTHQKNTRDLYGFFNKLFHHNPQVRGSNP